MHTIRAWSGFQCVLGVIISINNNNNDNNNDYITFV